MESKESQKSDAILRKVRSPIMALFGLLLPNSYYPIVASKEIYDGSLKQAFFPGLNCHACPTVLVAYPIGIFQHFSALARVPFTLVGFLGSVGMIGWLSAMKITFLVIFLALFVFTSRPFCRTLCPLRVIYFCFD